MKSFKSFAVMADWENPYITLQNDYEVRQLKVFSTMLKNGLISRKNKPVYWGCETHTALAEGELEYNDNHISTAAYISFPITNINDDSKQLLSKSISSTGLYNDILNNLKALIWTSTPWTIASNKAISINSNLNYKILHSKKFGYLIIADTLIENVLKLTENHKDDKCEILSDIIIPGSLLVGSRYKNPLFSSTELGKTEETFPILNASYVTSTTGTGLVHNAPGHGDEDYFICKQNGIEPYSPVDDYGQYTDKIPKGLEDLIGLKVLGEGTKTIIDKMYSKDMLFKLNKKFKHSYPYDWRSKKPIIIRSTPQWFADVESLKKTATNAINKVKFYPEKGQSRLLSFVNNRSVWCISRQRAWGVPIPALYEKTTGDPLLTEESVDHIINQIEKYGTDAWFEEEVDISRWLPNGYEGKGIDYRKGTETMDVWFDSGTSWTLLKEKYGYKPDSNYIADVYLEGSDQHRGWFQSSLLTKIATEDSTANDLDSIDAPYKTVITHGFTLDEKGQKMSKSLGNVIAPDSIIFGEKGKFGALGVDGLRLWVASSDYTNDVTVGPTVLKHVGERLRKIRVTLKFILGNISDLSKESLIPYDKMLPLDKYVLSGLYSLIKTCENNYETYNYNRVVQEINHHVTTSLSSSYFDIIKDRLYADDPSSLSRLSAQSCLIYIFQVYISLLSPLIPLITQEAWNFAPNWLRDNKESPFMIGWKELPKIFKNRDLEKEFELIWNIKDEIKLLLERARKEDKNLKNSLESSVYLDIKDSSLSNNSLSTNSILTKYSEYLADYFLCSQVYINDKEALLNGQGLWKYEKEIVNKDNGDTITISIVPSGMCKCPRCWKFTSKSEEDLCNRCDDVVNHHHHN